MNNNPNSAKRSIVSLYVANSLSLIGNVLSELAVPWFVYELTGSATATAGVMIAGQLPNILVGLFSGQFIDRFSAKAVSLFTDAVNFMAIALIPLLFHLNALDMLWLGMLVFFSKVFDTPGHTARHVMLAELIEKHQLPRDRVNGLYSLLDTIADLIGPIIAGLLLTLIGAVYLMVIDAITFGLSFLIIALGFGLKKHSHHERRPVSVWVAWRWLFRTPIVRKLAIYDAVLNTVATALLAVALPVLAKNFSGNGTLYGLWMSGFACGTTLTAALYSWLGHRLNPITLLKITPIGQVIGLLIIVTVLVMGWPLILVAGGLFLFGANLGVGSMMDAKLLQTYVPENMRGSIFAAFSSTRFVGVPFGLFIAGWLLDSMAVNTLFGFFMVLCFFASVLWWGREPLNNPSA
ncbi:MFS transporter [Reinekea marinisedimentorum]|nr:MFS transporter [Reinekea marinisedimentorum]